MCDVKGRELTKGKFVTGVCDSMKGRWDQLSTAQEKWEVLRSALCDTASSIVGHAHKREADWFRDSEAELRPLFEERSKMHALWLGTGQPRLKRKFMMARRSARKAVRKRKTNGSRLRRHRQCEEETTLKWYGNALEIFSEVEEGWCQYALPQ